MRPWMIVSSGAIGAIIVAFALAAPEVVNAPRSDIGPILLAHLPALAVAALAVYALFTILLATATLVADIFRLRRDLARTVSDREPVRQDWITAFGANGLRQLAPRLAPVTARSATHDGSIMLEAGFAAGEARSEIARLYYIALARCHFLTALVVLAAIVCLGLTQGHRLLPFEFGAIPMASAILTLVALVLLAVLGRIAVDVTAEPLLETIAQLPTERAEIRLLRRAVELLELACEGSPADDRERVAPAQIPERLAAVIEQGHDALIDAVGRLSQNTEALTATMRESLESFEALRENAAHQAPANDANVVGALEFPELRGAIEELTGVLQRLSAVPEDAPRPAPAREPAEPVLPPRSAPTPRLARELRRLLQEIDTAR